MGDFLRFGQFWVGAESIPRMLTFLHVLTVFSFQQQ